MESPNSERKVSVRIYLPHENTLPKIRPNTRPQHWKQDMKLYNSQETRLKGGRTFGTRRGLRSKKWFLFMRKVFIRFGDLESYKGVLFTVGDSNGNTLV